MIYVFVDLNYRITMPHSKEVVFKAMCSIIYTVPARVSAFPWQLNVTGFT